MTGGRKFEADIEADKIVDKKQKKQIADKKKGYT